MATASRRGADTLADLEERSTDIGLLSNRWRAAQASTRRKADTDEVERYRAASR
jgi:hypothetical protein